MSSELWTAQDAARATGGRLVNGDAWMAGGVSIDTRTLEPGDLFVALKDVRDGHDFLAQAFVSGACAALQKLAESQAIPVAHTMSGKGSIACTHPLSVGLFGRYSRIANDFIATADCLLVVGCKLGEIATKRYALIPPTVPIIHLEVMAEEIGRTTATEVALCGDAREGLADLLDGGQVRVHFDHGLTTGTRAGTGCRERKCGEHDVGSHGCTSCSRRSRHSG